MNSLVEYVYWKWDAILSKEFCRSALEQIDWATSKDATLGADKNKPLIDPKTRRTDVIWQPPMQP